MIHQFCLFLLLFSFSGSQLSTPKAYQYEYYDNGVLKSEGWKSGNTKEGYWYFYYPNGKVYQKGKFSKNEKHGYWYFYSQHNQLYKEGHFISNKAEKWWIIYDIASDKESRITRKYQYKNNKKNGYCLLYKNDKLFKAEKYSNDLKLGEWTDIFSFKKDNPNASL